MIIDRTRLVVALLAAFSTATVLAHGNAEHDAQSPKTSKEETPFGKAGDPARVQRTIEVKMSDQMRFDPASIVVKRGETVRFRVTNTGRALHEMVIGRAKDLEEHAALMRKFPEMEHDEAHMAHVAPGNTQEIVWQFTRAGNFKYGCLAPGHFEAGMVGDIKVR